MTKTAVKTRKILQVYGNISRCKMPVKKNLTIFTSVISLNFISSLKM